MRGDASIIIVPIFFTKNIFVFLAYHLKPLAQKVELFVTDINDLLKKRNKLEILPDHYIHCTIDVFDLLP